MGAVETSVMSIDAFETYDYENEYLSFFSKKFLINRIRGG